MIALEDAGLAALAGILSRQHWETWLVSLYVLLGGQEALLIVAGDDIFWKRRLSGALGLGIDYHPDWSGTVAKLNYRVLSDRVLALLKVRATVRPGVTGYDITYSVQSLFALHANMATIGGHIAYGNGEWTVDVEPPPLASVVTVTPVLHTAHLAQYVFREFGLDRDVLDPFVADLMVPVANASGA